MEIEALAKEMDYLQMEKLIKAYVKSGYESVWEGSDEIYFRDYKEMFVENVKAMLLEN